ncbi:MAG: RHS repeat-associated core domain-containing protein [Sandaracinus sp.]
MLRTTDIDEQASNHAGWTAIASVSSRSVERAGLPSGTNTCSRTEGMDQRAALRAGREEDAYVAEVAPRTSVQASQDRITNHDGSYVLITYDDALRVRAEAYRGADDSVIDNIEYTYDLDGNRRTRRHGATPATSTFEEYTYAAGDELTTVSVAGTPTQTWEHDDAGRTTRITRSGHDQHLAYDADDHITSIVDGAAETRWQFDAEGRTRREDLSGGITDSTHRYVQGATTDASLDSAHMVTTDAGAEELAYVFAPIPGGAEHPLFRYDPTTGEAVYYLQDSMGSVIGLVDETTTQTATFEYDGFGGERSATGALASLPVASRGDYRFHGMWLDGSVRLYYVRARVYDAAVGRFLSNDPAEGSRAEPESFECTRFVRGSPGLATDPSGRVASGTAELNIGGVITGILEGLEINSARGLAVALLRELGRQLIRVAVVTAVAAISPENLGEEGREAILDHINTSTWAMERQEHQSEHGASCLGIGDSPVTIALPTGRDPAGNSALFSLVWCGRAATTADRAKIMVFVTSSAVSGRPWAHESTVKRDLGFPLAEIQLL